jgi:hypothetical protein
LTLVPILSPTAETTRSSWVGCICFVPSPLCLCFILIASLESGSSFCSGFLSSRLDLVQ